ncbi:hypothetical protein POPTR_008G073450v4 [Populus trichocarpa]|uniref:Uncharacterized protein n=1 Tax=Populus trichocarpa TaxID=3694 RepID=A0ACC0SKC4_POPTR|nr:hypothetical protein POPTR_008G073450v4 [Populus trichocarpa]
MFFCHCLHCTAFNWHWFTKSCRKLHSKHWVNSSAAEIQVQKQVELRQFHDCQHPVPNRGVHRIDSATIALHERLCSIQGNKSIE